MSQGRPGRERADKRAVRDRRSRYWGALVLASLGLALGYLFIVEGRTWISIAAGLLLVGFTSYLLWNHLRPSR